MLLIAIATLHKFEIYQMDVKMVFLNGELEVEIYIEWFERFALIIKSRRFVNSLGSYMD